jgi:ADP-dependent NAD(P)H-hydrate dehydratase / NAD(P)H-hydrate epimerase
VDADGLKLLAQIQDWPHRLPAVTILTPHPGEMSLLTGLSVGEIQAERLATAERFSRRWGHVVILKGANSLVAAPDGRTALIPVATPALARAGTGDVLAGLAAGLRGQGMDPFEAATCAAWIHARAGVRSLETIGSSAAVLAGDVLEALGKVLQELNV